MATDQINEHKVLDVTEFEAELADRCTRELASYRLQTCVQRQQHAILRVDLLESRRHQKFQQLKSETFQFSATRSDLASMLRACLHSLEATPEHRMADSLEKIAAHLECPAAAETTLNQLTHFSPPPQKYVEKSTSRPAPGT